MLSKTTLAKPKPTAQWHSVICESCIEKSNFQNHRAPSAFSLVFLIRLITQVWAWRTLPCPASCCHSLFEWQAGAVNPGKNRIKGRCIKGTAQAMDLNLCSRLYLPSVHHSP